VSDLQGKVAIITGAAGGVGGATARLFAANGAQLVLVDRNEAALSALAAELGPSAAVFAGDVSTEACARDSVALAKRMFGGLDIFHANAGRNGQAAPISDVDPADFDTCFAINTRGPMLGMKYAAPAIVERGGGSIIITASLAGLLGVRMGSSYIASKHAVIGLMKAAALDLAPFNVRVNAICPGGVDNAMMWEVEEKYSPGNPLAMRAMIHQGVPMGRYASNEEVAQMALFLAGPRSSFSTGGVFTMDGGFSVP
jgi:3alpha(or 20beta)-hydroxysteroid dehydrogenase